MKAIEPYLMEKGKGYESLTWQAYASIRYGLHDRLEGHLQQLTQQGLISALEYSIQHENHEAVLLCEREIARRGLHVEDNEGRFTL